MLKRHLVNRITILVSLQSQKRIPRSIQPKVQSESSQRLPLPLKPLLPLEFCPRAVVPAFALSISSLHCFTLSCLFLSASSSTRYYLGMRIRYVMLFTKPSTRSATALFLLPFASSICLRIWLESSSSSSSYFGGSPATSTRVRSTW